MEELCHLLSRMSTGLPSLSKRKGQHVWSLRWMVHDARCMAHDAGRIVVGFRRVCCCRSGSVLFCLLAIVAHRRLTAWRADFKMQRRSPAVSRIPSEPRIAYAYSCVPRPYCFRISGVRLGIPRNRPGRRLPGAWRPDSASLCGRESSLEAGRVRVAASTTEAWRSATGSSGYGGASDGCVGAHTPELCNATAHRPARREAAGSVSKAA